MSNTRLFVIAGLLVALGLGVAVSPFASSSPDGLERVAEDQGFAGAADDHDLADSPVADYQVRGVDDERTGTALSGLVGVLMTFGVGVAVFAGLRSWRGRGERPGPAVADGGMRAGGAATGDRGR